MTDRVTNILALYIEELRATVEEKHASLVWAYKQTDDKQVLLKTAEASIVDLEALNASYEGLNASYQHDNKDLRDKVAALDAEVTRLLGINEQLEYDFQGKRQEVRDLETTLSEYAG
jgi:chromosome segregation ATPase